MGVEEVFHLSGRELDRAKIIQQVLDKRLSVTQASKQLNLSRRQTTRLVSAFSTYGPAGIVSRRRGRTSNRAFSDNFKLQVLSVLRQHYADFGPTLATEKLAERHNLHLSAETTRKWMISEGLWSDRRAKEKRAYQPRYRRECFGELIQIDGSEHYWFEDRGSKCSLLVFIDDATSKLVELRFTEAETTFAYFYSTQRYLQKYGKPVALYSDKHSVFRINKQPDTVVTGNGLTQFGRALHELNIDIIYANSSQAKGRVERMNLTLQDRLVKELRLAGINTIEEANIFLPKFIEQFNAKFSKVPQKEKDLHRALTESDNLTETLCVQEPRTISNNLTVQYNKVLYLIEDNEFTRELKRKKATVFDYPDGTIAIKYNGVSLPHTMFDKVGHIRQQDIVDNKRLGATLAYIKKKQTEKPLNRNIRSQSRNGQKRIQAEVFKSKNPALKLTE